jgi:hypothetical protein
MYVAKNIDREDICFCNTYSLSESDNFKFMISI